MATNYRWKAETELWMSDPGYWVWQEWSAFTKLWFTPSSQHPPSPECPYEIRLVPRPWLEEPEKWEVWFLSRTMPTHVWSRADPHWNHREFQYELRPRTAYQARVEIPAPETKAPEVGNRYFIADPAEARGYIEIFWRGVAVDLRMLERNLVYLTPENAAARSEAMRKIER